MQVTLLYFDECPNWQMTADRLEALRDELGLSVVRHEVTTIEEADAIGFLGSPTLQVAGKNLFAEGDEPDGLSCASTKPPMVPPVRPRAGSPGLGSSPLGRHRHD